MGGARSACPGTLRLLEAAHQRWGKLPWERVFEPAIRLAEDGFAISPRLNGLLGAGEVPPATTRSRAPISTTRTASRRRSAPSSGTRPSPGPCAPSPRRGAEAFYEGEIAAGHRRDRHGPHRQPRRHDPRRTSRATRSWSGGRSAAPTGSTRSAAWARPARAPIAVQQILAILETRDMAAPQAGAGGRALVLGGGAAGLRGPGALLGDPAFVHVPVRGLTDRGLPQGPRRRS